MTEPDPTVATGSAAEGAAGAAPDEGVAPRTRFGWHGALLLVPVALAGAIAGAAWSAGDGLDAADTVGMLLVLAWVAAGAIVAASRPLCRLGVVVLAGTALGGALFAGSGAVDAGWVGAGRSAADAARHLAMFVLPAVAAHVLLSLPDGRLRTGGARATALVLYAAGIAAGATAQAAGGAAPAVVAVAWVVALLAAAPGSHARYLATGGTERKRLQWVGCGATTFVEVTLIVAALYVLVDWPDRPMVVAGAASILLPVSVAAGAFPRMVERVDRLLVHTVSLAGLTAVTVGVYLMVVLGLGRVPEDSDRNLLGLSMLAAGLAALLYVPARERLADAANRLVYGERHAPDEVLRTFGSRLTRAIPMDELLLQLVESLRKTMALTRAEVWTGSGELLERTVSVPYAEPVRLAVGPRERPVVARAGVSGGAWAAVWLPAVLEGRTAAAVRVAPITHSGELLGLIVIERPAGHDPFTEEDDRVLTELARQAGLALHNVQLDSALQATLDEVRRANEELQASRARIVATGDAERRKIERNLHDGAQQQLVALAVNLRLARDVVAEDPAGAAEMLDELATVVKETIQELRDLAHGIYPPLLVASGLPDALRAAAARSPLGVDVECDGVGRYDGEVEAAIYFCCLEALQNAAKHAPGATVTVRLWEEAGGLLFEVTDDGPGFDAAVARRGHGFVNMSDRLGAIGGSVRWDSSPGQGATVIGSVPLGAAGE